MKLKWTKVAACLTVAFLLVGCSNTVVGRVGDKEIKQADVDKRIAIFKLFSPDFDVSTIARADIVDQLLEEQMVIAAADEKGITVTDEEAQLSMDEIKEGLENQFGDEKKTASTLKKFNITWDDLKEIVVNNIKIQQLYTQVTADVKVTDEEVQKYYQDHVAEFAMPEQVKASHILVEEEKLANELRTRIEKGEDFAELAKEHSADPGSRENGGELGYFSAGRMVPEFDKAAFSTPVGQISPVIKTEHGYHIIKVEDKKPARTLTLEEVKPFLSMQMENQKKNEKFLAYIEQLKTETQLENKLAKDKPAQN